MAAWQKERKMIVDRPLIVALEGLDGVGKTTIANLLRGYYQLQARRAHMLAFPYGEKRFSDNLATNYTPDLVHDREAYWRRVETFTAARVKASLDILHLTEHNPDRIIILDRWEWSAIAYAPKQMSLDRAKEISTIIKKSQELKHVPHVEPDLHIFLDQDLKAAPRRAPKDHLDTMGEEYKAIINHRYMRLAGQAHERIPGSVKIIPTERQTVKETFRDTLDIIGQKLKTMED